MKKRIKFASLNEIGPEEVFLDFLVQKKEDDFFEKKIEVPLSKSTSRWFFILILIIVAVLFFVNFKFQAIEKDKFLALAEKNKFILKKVSAERGVIYDRNLRQLVFNQSSFDLLVAKNSLPKESQERLKILRAVAEIIKKDFDVLKKEIEESQDPEILVAKNIDYQTLLILETRISELQGFSIKNNTIRDYFAGEIFSPLLGYKRKGGDGTGLENYYENVLREKPGDTLSERNVHGDLISQKVISLPESGDSLLLWLDSELQEKTYQELKKSMEENNADIGAAVVLDAKTGGVLSLVSFPGYDNNLFSKGMTVKEWESIQGDQLNPLFNQAISGGYQTGSVIKPLLASAALQESIISPQKQLNCGPYIEVKNKYNPEIVYRYNDWKIHGLTDMRKALAQSSNVYFYTIGGGHGSQEGLGPSRIKKYLELFGWGSATGIDIPGESAGFLPDPEWKKEKFGTSWTDGNTYHYAIGQEYIRVTPLQVAASFLPIANGGKLLKPEVVKGILNSDKNLLEEIKPEIIREGFIDDGNLKVVREGMRQAVTYGSCAPWLNDLPFPAACKTGTAQIGIIDPADGKDYYEAWAVVFAPYDDPEIVLVIMVHNVKKAHNTVMPVARSVLEWYFSNEKIKM